MQSKRRCAAIGSSAPVAAGIHAAGLKDGERLAREALEQQLQRSAEHASRGLPRPPEERQAQEISVAVAGQLNGKSLPIVGASDVLAQV